MANGDPQLDKLPNIHGISPVFNNSIAFVLLYAYAMLLFVGFGLRVHCLSKIIFWVVCRAPQIRSLRKILGNTPIRSIRLLARSRMHRS